MKPINEKLRSDILEISKKEFLKQGYSKTTVRNIATAVGCTTGAIYRYYKDKAAIFDALVKDAADTLLIQYEEKSLNISSGSEEVNLMDVPDMSANEFDWIVDYIYDHYDVFRLISTASEGTDYEHYIEALIRIEEESTNRFVAVLKESNMLKTHIDPIMAHILANTLFSGIFETVRHDLPRHVAMAHMRTLQQFYLGGWNRLFELNPSE